MNAITKLATASYTPVRNGGKFTAIAVCGNVNGKQVQLFSLPSQLNGSKLPALRELRGLLDGVSVEVSEGFNMAMTGVTMSDVGGMMYRVELASETIGFIVVVTHTGTNQYAVRNRAGMHVRMTASREGALRAVVMNERFANRPAVKVDLRKKVDLAKRPARAPLFVDDRTNEQIMLDTLSLIRHKRLSLSTVYTVKSADVIMGSYLAESKPAALDACAREHGFASFADMETRLGRTLNFEVFAEFVNPLAGVSA